MSEANVATARPDRPRDLGTAARELAKMVLRAAGGREMLEGLVRPDDLGDVTDDALEAYYRSNGRRFVVGVPLERCRTLGTTAFACMVGTGNPFVETLVAYGEGRCRSFAESPLCRFYESWQPATRAEAIGLAPESAHPALRERADDAPPTPWARKADGVLRTERTKLRAFQAARRGAGVREEDVDGIIFYGPVTDAFGMVTFERLTRLYDAIRREGYKPNEHRSGHIATQLMVDEHGDWRVIIRSGKHRVAVLAALGYERVPVQMAGRHQPAVVHRGDVRSWPNVRGGLFSREEALAVFDRMFEARQPAGCDWPSRGKGMAHERAEVALGPTDPGLPAPRGRGQRVG